MMILTCFALAATINMSHGEDFPTDWCFVLDIRDYICVKTPFDVVTNTLLCCETNSLLYSPVFDYWGDKEAVPEFEGEYHEDYNDFGRCSDMVYLAKSNSIPTIIFRNRMEKDGAVQSFHLPKLPRNCRGLLLDGSFILPDECNYSQIEYLEWSDLDVINIPLIVARIVDKFPNLKMLDLTFDDSDFEDAYDDFLCGLGEEGRDYKIPELPMDVFVPLKKLKFLYFYNVSEHCRFVVNLPSTGADFLMHLEDFSYNDFWWGKSSWAKKKGRLRDNLRLNREEFEENLATLIPHEVEILCVEDSDATREKQLP